MSLPEYNPVPVETARRVGDEFGKSIVIINAWDPVHGKLHTTTWGRSGDEKGWAALGGQRTAQVLGAVPDLGEIYQDYRIQLLRRMTRMIQTIAVFHGGTHEEDCPVDDTCTCAFKPFNDEINAVCNAGHELFGDLSVREVTEWPKEV
jgi:hypothetical protein